MHGQCSDLPPDSVLVAGRQLRPMISLFLLDVYDYQCPNQSLYVEQLQEIKICKFYLISAITISHFVQTNIHSVCTYFYMIKAHSHKLQILVVSAADTDIFFITRLPPKITRQKVITFS